MFHEFELVRQVSCTHVLYKEKGQWMTKKRGRNSWAEIS